MKILLVEDDLAFTQVLTRALKTYHYSVDSVSDGEAGWTYGSTFDYDLIVMDIVLPKLDGISLCQRLRAAGHTTPILLLTAQDTNTAKVQGLDAGADDYVVKPFDQAEFLARIRALLRRSSSNPMPLLTWGDLLLNPSTCEVQYGGQNLSLTGKEYELLELMLRDSQHVFGVDELLEHLWSSEDFPSEATVRSHIRRVRQKLAASGAPHDFIATLHGRGYYLKPPASSHPSPAIARPAPPTTATGGEHAAVATTQPPSDIAPPPPGPPAAATAQAEYLQFLNATWQTTRPKSLEQVETLQQAIEALAHPSAATDALAPPPPASAAPPGDGGRAGSRSLNQAQHLAHKLAGTLSLFGLQQAVQVARQLEQWLGQPDAHAAASARRLRPLVQALRQAIQQTDQIQAAHIPQGTAPQFLLVSDDARFNQTLAAIAPDHAIALTTTSPTRLETPAIQPDVILLRPPPAAPRQPTPPPSDACITTLAQQYPQVPLVVMGHWSGWRDRLHIIRQGGHLLADAATAPAAILDMALRLLRDRHRTKKVMVVDDDSAWLTTLPTLLQPWGFKVTTLADPQQFWTVLQMVVPDVLVMDVDMPEISGFELCQILRSDPHWQQLPVLFLSVLTDASSQQQAFTVGADDYLCKPLQSRELAHRILHRLERIQAYTN